MARHRLAPVTSILPSPLVHWGPTILHDLAARDIQRAGGAEQFADKLDAQEQAVEDQERQTMQSDLDALSRESCLFQDVTDFGLGAAAVIGRPHAKRAVHRVGQISNGKDCHDFISWKIRQ
jgi:hypothetical protein